MMHSCCSHNHKFKAAPRNFAIQDKQKKWKDDSAMHAPSPGGRTPNFGAAIMRVKFEVWPRGGNGRGRRSAFGSAVATLIGCKSPSPRPFHRRCRGG
mmetsp:Transcript_26650/g.59768  ORF Transcript_26650/g.59768 Transcript_26650/m.59768 type:complete len:97 (-) Transcript_26650:2185-2475(-)